MQSAHNLAALFAALAEPTRLRLLLLCRRQALQVGQCARSLNLPEPAVSRHLATLAQAGLLQREREGREVRYLWSSAAGSAAWLEAALAPLAADATARRDGARLERLRAASGIAPFTADSVFGQRLAAALRQLVSDLPRARVLGIDLEQGAVVAALQSGAASLSLIVRDKRQRRAVAAFARSAVLEFDWADEQAPQPSFDLVCIAVRDAAQLPQRVAATVAWLASKGRLVIAVPYDALEQAAGRGGPHPLFCLRTVLGGQGIGCERLLPVEADGEHWLLATGVQSEIAAPLQQQA